MAAARVNGRGDPLRPSPGSRADHHSARALHGRGHLKSGSCPALPLVTENVGSRPNRRRQGADGRRDAFWALVVAGFKSRLPDHLRGRPSRDGTGTAFSGQPQDTRDATLEALYGRLIEAQAVAEGPIE